MAYSDGSVLRREPMEFPVECRLPGPAGFRPEFSYLSEVQVERIAYASDGLAVSGFLAKPRAPGPWPCVVFSRGGNREFAAITPLVAAALVARIASWGYVVAASQYRGCAGSEGMEQFGGEDLDDVLNLFPLLEAEEGADASRIGMYGGSRGGMMTYLALARTDRVKAAVIRCGVSDLTDWSEDRPDMEAVFKDLIPGYESGDDAPLRARSAVYWPERLCKTTPLLLLQGSADWRVSTASTLRFAEALYEAKHPFRLVVLEGSDHALSEHIPERDRQAKEWFDRFVRDGAPLPRLEPHGD
jgi:dipeptidyl aminopeptidase/acylaminoacyl peptidase